MLPAPFEYHAPKTVDEALELLDQLGDAGKVLAGGQSLIPLLKLRFADPGHLVDINKIKDLDYLEEREGTLREKIRFFCRFALLIVDEIGYLPVIPGGGNLFFQLVNARYERGAMILTSNRGFAEWGEVFGDPVLATALLDRLLHHAVVIAIDHDTDELHRIVRLELFFRHGLPRTCHFTNVPFRYFIINSLS